MHATEWQRRHQARAAKLADSIDKWLYNGCDAQGLAMDWDALDASQMQSVIERSLENVVIRVEQELETYFVTHARDE